MPKKNYFVLKEKKDFQNLKQSIRTPPSARMNSPSPVPVPVARGRRTDRPKRQPMRRPPQNSARDRVVRTPCPWPTTASPTPTWTGRQTVMQTISFIDSRRTARGQRPVGASYKRRGRPTRSGGRPGSRPAGSGRADSAP